MRPRRHVAPLYTLLAAIVVLVSAAFSPTPRPLFAAPAPSISITGNSFAPLGQQTTFTLTFQNTGTQTGFGPFIDLVFPATGADGNDGLSFLNATYLGTALETRTLTFPAGGCVAHPFARLISGAYQEVCGTPGDTLVVLRLPFGSFTPTQPAIDITVVGQISDLADLDHPLTVRTRTGFQFGSDALNNWCCDTLLLSVDQGLPTTTSSTWPTSATVTPTLINLRKNYNGPEDETATGPNFPRSYTLSADVAAGQTVRSLVITDTLPNDLAFLSLDASSPPHTSLVTPPVGAPSNPPTNQLAVGYPDVLGGTGSSDASATFSFFATRLDADGNPVLDPNTGLAVPTPNNLRGSYSWTPLDPRDAIVTATVDLPGPEHQLTLRSLAVQKGVAIQNDTGAAGYTPGDTVAYTLELQISDFFAFDNVVLTDIMDDGLRFDPSFVPTLQVNGNGFVAASSGFDPANYTVDTSQIGNNPDPATDGSTTFSFRVSNELVTRGHGARLVGGCINPTTGSNPPNCSLFNDGATTATLVFRAIIQDSFSDTYPSGDASVDEGDVLNNRVTAAGRVLDATSASFTPTLNMVSDTSSASLSIQRGTIAKTIYALNGSTTLPNPFEVTAGDVVTYRLRTTLPSSDIEQLRLVDYLPLPIFNASEVLTFTQSVVNPPPAGTVAYGPGHTLNTIAPTLHPTMTVSALGNSVEFNYGSFDDPLNRPSMIDLLLSVTVSDKPTADQLFITNQLRRFSGATNAPDAADDAIVQIKITQPVLRVSKGVIGTSNPGASFTAPIGPPSFTGPGSVITSTMLITNPVDADVSGVDANDTVSFAIVLENVGSGTKGAFDIAITDTLPLGLVIPPGGINLQAHTGAGVAKPLTFLGPSSTANDLFVNGVQLVDEADKGACQKFDPTSGANIIVLTYDLKVDPNIPPGTPILNRGTLTSYASIEGGTNHIGPGSEPFDRASVTPRIPTLSKAILSTSEAHTADPSADTLADPRPVAIGEVVRFTLAYSIPEGLSSSLRITDTLPAGMIYVANSTQVALVSSATGTLTSTTLSGVGLHQVGNTPNVVASFALAPAAVTGGLTSGAPVSFSLGDLRNSDNDNDDEFVVVQFGAVVDNTLNGAVARNLAGTNLSNSATATTSSLIAPISSGSVHLRVLEPQLTITKLVVDPADALADANDVVTYTVTITNSSSVTSTTGFDLVLDNILPTTKVTLNTGSLSASGSAGATGLVTSFPGNVPTLSLTSLAPGATATFTYSVTLLDTVNPNEVLTNTATVRYTSVPGANGTANATPGASGADDGERSGFVAGNQNIRYLHTAAATVTIFEPAPSKELFATSEAHTVGTDVAIGEVLTFRLAVRLAEGTSPNLQLRDPLPRGLNYITNTARVALVSANPSKLTSSTIGSGAHIAGNNPNVAPSFVLPANAASLSGDTVTFSLGTIINSESDTDSEYVVLTFQAVVDNEGLRNNANSNDAGESLTNTFTMLVGGVASVPSDPVTVQVVEPQLTMSKLRTSPTNPDAGDVTAYTITITNSGSLTSTLAFDTVITESLHVNLVLDPASISLTIDGNPATFSGLTSSANGFTLTLPNLNPGQVAALSFTTTVADTVLPGQSLTNTTTLRYTSLPGDNGTGNATPGAPGTGTGERTGSGNTSTVNDHYLTANANHNSRDLGRNKYVNQTSEPVEISGGNNPPNLVIGEVARFRMGATIPEGNTPALLMLDDLPDGLVYLDGTARIVFVSNGGGISSTTVTPALPGCSELTYTSITTTLALNNNEPARSNLKCPIAPTSIAPNVGSTRYSFDLGNITNADRDSDSEYIVIDFEALVSNVDANQAGLVLTNTFRTVVNNGTPSNATNRTVQIAEPAITLSQTRVGSGPVDAGDVVTYTVTITNIGSATSASASDVLVQVPLPPGLGSPSLVGSATSTGSAVTVTTSLPSGVPTLSIGRLQAQNSTTTSTTTFTFTAIVQNVALAGQTITTTATATYTSLPGATGTVPAGISADKRGTPGAANGERIGIAADPLNDYITSAPSTVEMLTPTISKALASGASATPTIGELVTYTLRLELPEGTTNSLVVTDTLPAGMAFVGSSSVADPNYAVDAPTVTATGNEGDPVIFSFPAPIVVPGDNNPANNFFTINLTARVLNVASNQQGVTRANTAALRFDDPESGPTAVDAPAPVTVTVAEPILDLAKSVFTPPNPADGGNVVEYQLVLSHVSGSVGSAYGVVFTDTLPANLTPFDPSNVSVNASGIAAPTFAYSGDTLRVPATGSLDLPPGATVTVRYKALVGAGVTAGETITNTAGVVWRSLPASGFERNGGPSGAPDGSDLLGGGALNDYEQRVQASFVIDTPKLNKTLISSSANHTSDPNLTIGETATYQIAVKVPQAVIPSMELAELLPNGLSVQSVTVDYTGFGAGPLVHSLTPALPAPSGTNVTLTWPAFTNPTDGNPDNNVFTVTLVARVADQASNQNGTLLTNTAALRLGGGPPIPSNDVTVNVVVPALALSKTFDRATALAGANLQVTVNLTNTGTSAAFGTIFTDTLSKDWFAAAPTPIAPSGLTVSVVGTPTAWLVVYSVTDPLAAGASVSASFAIALRTDLYSSVPLVLNTVHATASSLPGGDPTARTVTTGPAEATVQVIAPDLAITKTGPANTTPGATVVYSLAYTNTGDVALTSVVITETVPAGTTFNATSSPGGWSCADASPAGTICTLPVGNLALAASGSANFAVNVPAAVPAGLDAIANTTSIADGGASGPERTMANNSSSVTTPLNATPELAITLEVEPIHPKATEPVTFTFTFTNAGPQDATGVVITLTVPLETNFRPGDNTGTGLTWTCTPPVSGDPASTGAGATCTTSIGPLAVGQTGSGKFIVRANADFDNRGLELRSTATIRDDGLNGSEATYDNNEDSAALFFGPNAITLMEFTATREAEGVRLRWTTGSELNTAGFRLLRGSSNDPASATPLESAGFMAGEGDLIGAEYTYLDTEAAVDQGHVYWLIEVERDGNELYYGPVSVAAPSLSGQQRVFMPLVVR